MSKVIINGNSRFNLKDRLKFQEINKLIAFSLHPSSSTYVYAQSNPTITNIGSYESTDIVGVSVNGVNRYGWHDSLTRTMDELALAIKAKTTIIQDANTSLAGGAFSNHNIGTEGVIYNVMKNIVNYEPNPIIINGQLVGNKWIYVKP